MKLLQKLRFICSQWDVRLWMNKSQIVYLTLYVDNMKLISSNENKLNQISQQIAEHFQIKNLEHIKHYLRMKVDQNFEKRTIQLSQEIYICQLLTQCKMKNFTLIATSMNSDFLNIDIDDDKIRNDSLFNSEQYQSVIKSLQFLFIYTQSDIVFSVSYLIRKNFTSKL